MKGEADTPQLPSSLLPSIEDTKEDHMKIAKRMVRIVTMSDTHCNHKHITVPMGDIFIHSGDFTNMGASHEIQSFNTFLRELPHKHKIVIAGNHDFMFEKRPEEAQRLLLEGLSNCYYLQDKAITIEGINFYGSPWQPEFYKWAFNLERGPALKEKWDLIPSNTDVLITHGPPKGILDRSDDGELCGCADLLTAIQRIKPKYHIFGHIHEGYGQFTDGTTKFINASNLNSSYRPTNNVISFDYPVDL